MPEARHPPRVLLLAHPDLGASTLARLLRRGPWRLAGVLLHSRSPGSRPTWGDWSFRRACRRASRRGVPVHVAADVNAAPTLAWMRERSADLGVIAGFSQVLGREALAAARLGFVNLHPSLLPAHRGATPTFWVVRRGESLAGVTLHEATARVDQGDILLQGTAAVGRRESARRLQRRLGRLGSRLVEDFLRSLARGEPVAGHPCGPGTADPPFSPRHALLDPQEGKAAVLRHLRACRGWLPARLALADGEVEVVGPRPCLARGRPARLPGRVHLDCGDGVLCLRVRRPAREASP